MLFFFCCDILQGLNRKNIPMHAESLAPIWSNDLFKDMSLCCQWILLVLVIIGGRGYIYI